MVESAPLSGVRQLFFPAVVVASHSAISAWDASFFFSYFQSLLFSVYKLIKPGNVVLKFSMWRIENLRDLKNSEKMATIGTRERRLERDRQRHRVVKMEVLQWKRSCHWRNWGIVYISHAPSSLGFWSSNTFTHCKNVWSIFYHVRRTLMIISSQKRIKFDGGKGGKEEWECTCYEWVVYIWRAARSEVNYEKQSHLWCISNSSAEPPNGTFYWNNDTPYSFFWTWWNHEKNI